MILYTLLAVNVLLTFFLFRRVNVVAKHLSNNQVRIADAIRTLVKELDKVEVKDDGQ